MMNKHSNANKRPASAGRRPAAGKQRSSGNRKNNMALKILKGIGLALLVILAFVGRLLSGLNRKFDVFRKSETTAVIVNTVLSGVVVVVLLCVWMLCKPGIDASRAVSLASRGKSDAAMQLIHKLEAEEYPIEKLNKTREGMVSGLIQSGKYEAAESLLAEMPEDEVRRELSRQNSYEKALSLYEAGSYAESAQIFYQIEDYRDSALRYADNRCALAIQAWQNGDEASARSLLLDVPDVVSRVSRAAEKVAVSDGEIREILSAPVFREENLLHMSQTMQEINAARKEMPSGRIAAGRYHTVGLKADGSVLCAGDNSMSQLDVAGWSGITQVAAGAFHTVGLKADGTVVAAGNNFQGQCEVDDWTDIVAVAAGSYTTVGLKKDGTVVACGQNSDSVDGWHDASFIAAGSYSMGCLYGNGAMLSSHAGAQLDMGAVLYDLSVCGQISVGVLYDGTMISSFEGAPHWTEMVSATVCETGILGIDVNGRVLSHFYRAGDAVQIEVPAEAVEVESSGTHHVVLTSDGRVYAYGSNDHGQCDVSGWQL